MAAHGAAARAFRRQPSAALRRPAALQEGLHAFPRELVGALVLGVAGVAAHPVPVHVVPGLGGIEPLPQVGVLDGLLGARAPAVALPAVDPRADPLLDIFRVGMDIDPRRPLQRLERRDRRRQLHAVVGGRRLAAGQLLAMRARDQDRAPPAGPGVSRAGTVRVDRDGRLRGGGLPRHGASPTPYSPAPRTPRWNLSRRRNSLGSLRLTSAVLAVLQPVVGARQEEAQGRAAREQGQGRALLGRQRTQALVAPQQRLALGHVEGVVALEAPGIEGDGDVVGERIVARRSRSR